MANKKKPSKKPGNLKPKKTIRNLSPAELHSIKGGAMADMARMADAQKKKTI